MKIDPDKQFIEDEEVVADIPSFDREEIIEAPTDLTKYALAATVAKNGMVLLWEWMPVEEARVHATEIQKRI